MQCLGGEGILCGYGQCYGQKARCTYILSHVILMSNGSESGDGSALPLKARKSTEPNLSGSEEITYDSSGKQ